MSNKNFSVTMTGSGTQRLNGGAVTTTSSAQALHAMHSDNSVRRRKPMGRWVPPTAYSMTERSWKKANGVHDHKVNATNTNRLTGFLVSVTSASNLVSAFHSDTGLPSSLPSDLANRALINARNNLKDTSLDLGVAFGERRETAQFVGDTLGLMGDFCLALYDARKGKFRKAKKVKQKLKRLVERIKGKGSYETFAKIPSLRLQWQYAVKPLMSDIYGAVTSLDDHSRDSWKVTVKGKAHFKAIDHNFPVFQTDAFSQSTCEAEVFHGCMVRIDVQPGNDALRKASQLGLTNPVNLAWELIPLSFVLDWALPLGDYFSSLDAMVGWELLGYSSTVFSKRRYTFTGTSVTPAGWLSCSNDWTSYYKTVSVARNTASSVPFPMLPSIKDPASHSHVADGLAILTQALSKWR
jgi:hypothetical protein